jgi:hypothetical protein
MNAVTATPARVDHLTIRGRRGGVVLLVAVAVLLAPAAAVVPLPLLVAGLVAVVLATVAYAHPPAAAYLVLVATPLTAGVARGGVVPLLRPHEALTVTVGAGVVLRLLAELRAGRRLPLRPGGVDVAILLMAVTSSLLPFLWMAARGLAPTQEDLLYATTIWKFYGLFVLIRLSVPTEREVTRCLYVSVAAASVTAVVTILQSLGVGPVVQIVGQVYPGEAGAELSVGRGSSTLGTSIGVGDVMALHLAICLGLLLRRRGSRRLLVPLAALFTLGALASGQFSGVIALGVGVFAIAVVTGQVKRLLLALVPVSLAGAVVLRPVLEHRLNQLDISTGIPQSWQVRFDNLRLFVWPELFSGNNWMFGVRPGARIQVDAAWGPHIYIESGHTWLLWTGGIPFLVAYLVFVWVAVQAAAAVARTRRDGIGVAAIAAFTGLLVVFVLMSFDPHLTMRGAGDLLFALLALALVASGTGRDRHDRAPVGSSDDRPLGWPEDRPPGAGAASPAPGGERSRQSTGGSPNGHTGQPPDRDAGWWRSDGTTADPVPSSRPDPGRSDDPG